MNFFTVDQEKCTLCGICSDACPAGLIKVKGDSLLQAFPGASNACLNCGHCVAICPTAAMSLPKMKAEQCPPMPKALLSPAEVEGFLRARRSIRNYQEAPVEKGVLGELVRISSHAPTGHNAQPLKWAVFYERERLKGLGEMVVEWMRYLIREQPEAAQAMHLDAVVGAWEKGKDVVFRGAPHVILAHAPKNNRFAPSAATIALSYMELAAPALGLGACWLGFFQAASAVSKPLQDALGLPEGDVSLGALAVGKPKYKYYRQPLRNQPEILWG